MAAQSNLVLTLKARMTRTKCQKCKAVATEVLRIAGTDVKLCKKCYIKWWDVRDAAVVKLLESYINE